MEEPVALFPFHYDPRLVEEAIFLAVRGHPEERTFHAGRDRFYDLADPEARDRAFQEYHVSWFARLRLGAPIEQAFAEQPSISRAVRGCVVGRAPRLSVSLRIFLPGDRPTVSARNALTSAVLSRSRLPPYSNFRNSRSQREGEKSYAERHPRGERKDTGQLRRILPTAGLLLT
ncbi:MAG: hypothetical protein HYZ72_13450 [Deltaproteobacteria bacterium]|nr:hypothetical protein [Deltaproteobacteria bacterium]